MLNLIVPLLLFLTNFDGAMSLSQLHITRIDVDVAQGKYTSGDIGIVFNSSSKSLSISDLFDNKVLVVQKISSYQQLIVIKESVFIQEYISETQSYHDYYVPQYLRNYTEHLSAIKMVSLQYHNKQLQKAIEELLNSYYYDLIRKAVYTLGNELTIYGNNFPSILPLYLVANMLEKLQESNTGRTSCVSKSGESAYDSMKEDSCFVDCPPCPEEECLSLCGYGCHCWKWVCGDCCYHLGCYGHDVCCRKNFIQTKCLFPISFKCESEYYC